VPEWLQEFAALTTVGLASVWLIVRWFRIGQPQAAQPGCGRCEHNPVRAATPPGGVRSARLRVID
jgi:hypothetical protein